MPQAVVFSADWNVALGGTSTFNATRTTVSPIEGAGSMRINVAADFGYWIQTAVAATRTLVYQFKINFADLPNADVVLIAGTFHSGIGDIGIAWDVTTGKFFNEMSHIPAGTPGGPVIVQGQTYTIDLLLQAWSATFTLDSMVDGEALPQLSDAGNTPENLADYRLMINSTVTTDVRFDSFYVSHVAEDYPLNQPTVIEYDSSVLPKSLMVGVP